MIPWLKYYWQNISIIGLNQRPDLPINQRSIVKITNQLAFFYTLVFTLVLLIDPSIWAKPLDLSRYVASIFAGIAIWGLNYRQLFTFSRIFTVLFPIFFFFLPPIIFKQVTAFQLIWFPFGLIIISISPIKLFDLKHEKAYWIPLSGIYLGFILLLEYWFYQIEPSLTQQVPIVYHQFNSFKNMHFSLWLIVNLFFYYSAHLRVTLEQQSYHTHLALQKQVETSQNLLQELKTQNETLKMSREEIASQRDQIAEQKNQISQVNERIAYFQSVLMNLTLSNPIQLGKWDESINIITHLASTSAQVSRVSIWEYVVLENKLVCLALYNSKQQSYELGMQLFAQDFPAYFEAIIRKDLIIASDAHNHPVTREFSDSYLRPLQINSLLDAPYFVDGELKGVICFEHQDSPRVWSVEEVSFAKSVADIITIAYKSMLRRLDLEQIQQQSQAIHYQNRILTQQKQYIDNINQSLEARIKERTQKLESQNQQLAEYAFINAHHLRGPLCRIIGLVNLMEMPDYQHETNDFIAKIRVATDELDSVIRTINLRLEEDGNLEEEDLQILRQNNPPSLAPDLQVAVSGYN
ncbi:MAG: GAF domain-containing protein [Microscillaceae bacterium]|jgi:hypothetical protein|nr:GAF domain-containing protein [Microscillaceae bacterium]